MPIGEPEPGGGPAFPSALWQTARDGQVPMNDGMSYRQWLIGMYLCGAAGDGDNLDIPDKEASAACNFADAIIKRLEAGL